MPEGRDEAEARAAATLVIIVHYGDPSLTARAVSSVTSGSVRPRRIAVVDHGPAGAGLDELLSGFPDVDVLRPGGNLGFAGGIAFALERCHTSDVSFVWLLNNDAHVEHEAAAELLAASQRAGDRALVSSLIVESPSGRVWFTEARFYPWWLRSFVTRHPFRSSEPDIRFSQRPGWRSIHYLPATSLLIPAGALSTLKGFDPAFFVYGEDVDLALRARRAGFDLVVARRSIVRHRTSSASLPAAKVRMIAAGALIVTARHFPWLLPVAIPAALLEGARRGIAERDATLLTQRLRGYRDAVRAITSTTRAGPRWPA